MSETGHYVYFLCTMFCGVAFLDARNWKVGELVAKFIWSFLLIWHRSAPCLVSHYCMVKNQRLMTTFEPRHDQTNKVTVRPAKTQISLGIRPVWSESSLSAWRKLGSLTTHWARSEDSDQTGRMPRLISVFAGLTVILLVLSRGGSFYEAHTHVKINESRLGKPSKQVHAQKRLKSAFMAYSQGNFWVAKDP